MLNSQFQSWSVFTDEVCFWLEKPGGCAAPGTKESKSFLTDVWAKGSFSGGAEDGGWRMLEWRLQKRRKEEEKNREES